MQATTAQSSTLLAIKKRNNLVKEHQKLVHKIVHRMINKCSEPYEDLFQVGCLGLIKAIERFKPELGNAFSSFAVPYIEGEILHYLRDQAPSLKIPRNALENHSKIKRIRRHLIALDRQIREEQLAQKIGMTADAWRFTEEANSKVVNLSWDDLVYEPMIKEDDDTENYSIVYEGLAKLSPCQRRVIRSRFFLNQSIAEIAKKLNSSALNIEAIISESIHILNLHIKNAS